MKLPPAAAVASSEAGTLGASDQASASSVTTSLCVGANPVQAWQGLLYYEQLKRRPPLLLRLLLPTPLRVTGPKSAVGDESTCEYQRGHLKKRITEVDPHRRLAFSVLEQVLPVGGARLLGGSYELRAVPGGGTEIVLTTRYRSGWRPRFFWEPLEAFVCHAFHRHLLSAMRSEIEGRTA